MHIIAKVVYIGFEITLVRICISCLQIQYVSNKPKSLEQSVPAFATLKIVSVNFLKAVKELLLLRSQREWNSENSYCKRFAKINI